MVGHVQRKGHLVSQEAEKEHTCPCVCVVSSYKATMNGSQGPTLRTQCSQCLGSLG